MKPSLDIETEIRIPASPDVTFTFFVDPEKYPSWQGVRAELDPRPGGIFRVEMETGEVARGEFVEVEPPRRLVFTWGWEDNPNLPPGSTTVEVTLTADGDDTVVRLRHTGIPDEESKKVHEDGWTMFLGRLRSAAGPPAG